VRITDAQLEAARTGVSKHGNGFVAQTQENSASLSQSVDLGQPAGQLVPTGSG